MASMIRNANRSSDFHEMSQARLTASVAFVQSSSLIGYVDVVQQEQMRGVPVSIGNQSSGRAVSTLHN